MNKKGQPDAARAPVVVHETRVFKAGNSLAIRIPNAIAKHYELEDGTAVDLGAERGMLTLRKAPSLDLVALIDDITPENVHAPHVELLVGSERW